MGQLIQWFTRNGVGANLLMAMIALGGLLHALIIRQEVFPEFSMDLISIAVRYPGATPLEVEESLSVRIEEAIHGLDGIKKLRSTSAEGFCTVLAELERGSDSARLLDDIKAKVDAIDTFPDEAEEPVVRELTNRRQVIDIALSGPADQATLQAVAERIRDDLSNLPGITAVEVANAPAYEMRIEVSEAKLQAHGLSFEEVAGAIRASSLDLPAGRLRTSAGEILLRSRGQAYRTADFAAIPVLARPDGTRLLLGDIATLVDGFEETDRLDRFDGQPGALVEVFRVGEQSALDIAESVKAYRVEAQAWLPEGIRLAIWQDQSKVLRDRLSLLVRNGVQGLILVFLLLALFLRFRLAFWVTMGIPVSFLGTFWLMPGLDLSINLISLFAFIVVLGIVVDDAIVVGENIHTHQLRHGEGLRGAIEGASEVAGPVTFGMLTTVAAFIPLLNVPGTIGKVMGVIPMIVIACLLFSFVESKLILPNHLAHLPKREGPGGRWRRFQDAFAQGLDRFVVLIYLPLLERALRRRLFTTALSLALILLTFGVVKAGWLRFEFFPTVEADFISASLVMPQGTPMEQTQKAIEDLEAAAASLRSEFESRPGGEGLFRHIASSVGAQPYRRAQSQNAGGIGSGDSGSHLGEVTIELKPAETRGAISSEELVNAWRERTGLLPDAVELVFSASLFQPGADVDLQLSGPDLDNLRAVANLLKEKLISLAGVSEVADSHRPGKREITLSLSPEGAHLGLSVADLARQLRAGFHGEELQRVQRGRDDVPVMLTYPRQERDSLGWLERMFVRTPRGSELPLGRVARLEEGVGFAAISRVNRQRVINVTADVNAAVVAPGDVLDVVTRQFLPEILSAYPDVQVSFEGQRAEQRDTLGGLVRGFAIAMLLIYALLAIPLNSYLLPLLIMTAIPFGLVGAVFGHLLLGLDLTIISMFGIVALSGVVVNDSLVMVDFINQHRMGSEELHQAVRQAGRARFRPIILTSITTFAGLLPLLLERSMQARFLIPMAVSLAFGVLFATFISLILVPCGYLMIEDLKSVFRTGNRQAGA